MTGNFPVGGPVPPGFGPVYPPPPKPSRAGVWLGSVACVLAAAALVVGVVALVTAQREPASLPKQDNPGRLAEKVFVPEADKALCTKIGPLMRAETERANAFLATGDPDSPERREAIPKFKAETLQWANQIQAVLNEDADSPRYLTRTLQQYVDGMLLYSENMYPDKEPDAYDNTTYDSAAVYYGGPLGTCHRVGVRW